MGTETSLPPGGEGGPLAVDEGFLITRICINCRFSNPLIRLFEPPSPPGGRHYILPANMPFLHLRSKLHFSLRSTSLPRQGVITPAGDSARLCEAKPRSSKRRINCHRRVRLLRRRSARTDATQSTASQKQARIWRFSQAVSAV